MKLSKKRLVEIIKEEIFKEYQIGDGDIEGSTRPESRIQDQGGTKGTVNKNLSYQQNLHKEEGEKAAAKLGNILAQSESGAEGQWSTDINSTKHAPAQKNVHTYNVKNKQNVEKINKDQKVQELIRKARQAGITVKNDGTIFTISYK